MAGLGGSVSAMQQGGPGEGTEGLGDMGGRCHNLAMATLPRDPRAHLRPSKVPEGPGLGPEAGVSLSPADAGSIDKVEGMSSSSGQGPTPWYKNKGFQIGTPSPWR